MSYSKTPGETFKMRGLTFRKDANRDDSWSASTSWGTVSLTLLSNGQWLAGFLRGGNYLLGVADTNRLKAFDWLQLSLVEMAKLEAP